MPNRTTWTHEKRVQMYKLLKRKVGTCTRNGETPDRAAREGVAKEIGCSLSALDAQLNNVKMAIKCSTGNERTYSLNVYAAIEAGFITEDSELARQRIFGNQLIPLDAL